MAGGVSHSESVNEVSVQCNKLNSLSTTIYVIEQVCIGWHRTNAYYTATLTFIHDFPVKVWGAYCTSVRIVIMGLIADRSSVEMHGMSNRCRHIHGWSFLVGLYC